MHVIHLDQANAGAAVLSSLSGIIEGMGRRTKGERISPH
jgi:hypothetical protein